MVKQACITLGYGHPKLVAAIKKSRLDDLCFAPRRFTCEPAVETGGEAGGTGAWRSRQGAVHDWLARMPSRLALEDRACRDRPASRPVSFWDAFHGRRPFGFVPQAVRRRGGRSVRNISGPRIDDPATEQVAPWDGYRCSLWPRTPSKRRGSLAPTMIALCARREQDVAAVVAEPMRGDAQSAARPGFWEKRVCAKPATGHGTLADLRRGFRPASAKNRQILRPRA